MRREFILIGVFVSPAGGADSLGPADLPGLWSPSGEFRYTDEVPQYDLEIRPDLSAKYRARNDDLVLSCEIVNRYPGQQVFVFNCSLQETHYVTLALAGWSLESGVKYLYGHEYWLGWPDTGDIYGGVPVSYKAESNNEPLQPTAKRGG